ncbi:hypothetical protein N7490_007408 [Penicillium lividum]|nr:hypothetical protein N7490_007408 [Penicillium lividum]
MTIMAIINRLYMHPLSKIPGPKLAAITSWYQFYYDIIENGTFIRQLPKLHEEYKSAVIRISPNHIHVNDPEFMQK